MQTPQTFLSEVILKAFGQPYDPAFTDEASVLEKTGVPVHLVEGDYRNLKITRPEDLALAEILLDGAKGSP
jgi:2-C-methyl-D-erythritol 4-phosphate cytidylyltransferase